MNACTSCDGRLDDCNESQTDCPWCGEPNCWPRFLDALGYHFKTGHTLSVQNRPTGLAEDVIVLPCRSVCMQGECELSARKKLQKLRVDTAYFSHG